MSKAKTQSAKTLRITQLGVLSAIIIAMTFVPYIGYINFGGLSITLIHIPVIIGAVVLGPSAGAILGGIWGLACLAKAILAPPSPIEGAIFWNPFVSVFPRILAGLVAGAIFALIIKHSKRDEVASGTAAVLGTVTNTVLVMGSIYLFFGGKLGKELKITAISFGGLLKYILAAFTVNALIEIVVAVVLTIPICKALRKANLRLK